jgi:hypothetical protein
MWDENKYVHLENTRSDVVVAGEGGDSRFKSEKIEEAKL